MVKILIKEWLMVNVANIAEESFSGLQSKIRCDVEERVNLCLNNGLSFN